MPMLLKRNFTRRYVVLHEALVPEFKRLQMIAVLDGVFGSSQEFPADRVRVWRLPDLGAAVADAEPSDTAAPEL